MRRILGLGFLCAGLMACTSSTRASSARGSAGYGDPGEAGRVTGVGIEGQDIRAMTDRMARDLLGSPKVASLEKPPYVIVDSEYFENQGSMPINKDLIVERLMIELNRAAAGRMFFVERQAEQMVARERERKRDGEVGAGSRAPTQHIAGADFRLTGKIMDQNAVDPRTGATTRYHQITFKLVDLEAGLTVWSNYYEMQKNSSTDVLYR